MKTFVKVVIDSEACADGRIRVGRVLLVQVPTAADKERLEQNVKASPKLELVTEEDKATYE